MGLGLASTPGPVGVPKCTPAALMFGHERRTPVDLLSGPLLEPEMRGGPDWDCFYNLCERLREVHELTRRALADARARQKQACVTHCCGEDSVPRAQTWGFSPAR